MFDLLLSVTLLYSLGACFTYAYAIRMALLADYADVNPENNLEMYLPVLICVLFWWVLLPIIWIQERLRP